MPGVDPISLGADAATGLVQTALGVAQMVQAGKQNREAQRLQKNLVRPDYTIPQEYKDNLALATSMEGQGMSDAAKEYYKTSTNNSLTSSINAILRGGGSVNNISDLYNNSDQNFASLAALDDELRLKKQQIYLDQNENMGSQETTKWQVNQYAPFQDQKQLIAQLRGQANDNRWKGMNTIGAAVGNAAMAVPIAMGAGKAAPGDAPPDASYFGGTQSSFGATPPGTPSMTTSASNMANNIYTNEMLQRIGKNIFVQ